MTGRPPRDGAEAGGGARDERRCDEVRLDLGGYVLGALDPAERLAVDDHLAHCPDCRDELVELAEMPALLGRLSEAEAAEGLAVAPAPETWDLLVERVASERRRARRRTMLSVAAVVLVTVLGAGALGEVLAGRGGTAVSTTTTTTTAQGVAATADLRGDADGTAIDLSIRGVPAGERCRLLVLDRTGRPQVVSEWQVDYGGTASVHATTAVAPAELTGLRVVTVGGTGLADLTIRART